MATARSSNLWSVLVENHNSIPSTHNLWILASNAENASKKARNFVKRNYESGFKVVKVQSEGTIDVF